MHSALYFLEQYGDYVDSSFDMLEHFGFWSIYSSWVSCVEHQNQIYDVGDIFKMLLPESSYNEYFNKSIRRVSCWALMVFQSSPKSDFVYNYDQIN